jgi:hypothetical protein
MTSSRTALTATAVAVAALAAPAAASAAPAAAPAAGVAPGARHHSRVVTYDRGEVLVRRLQMSVRRERHRLRTTVHLIVLNRTAHAVDRELQVGRCTGGSPAFPVCPAHSRVRIHLGAHQRRSFVRQPTLRQPGARLDAVQAALVRSGARQPLTAARTDAALLVRGRAWRGSTAGRLFGVRFDGPTDLARRLSFDIPVTAPDRAYADVIWEGAAAPDQSRTFLEHCLTPCTRSPLPADPRRSGPQRFGTRFDLDRAGADAIDLVTAGPDGAPLITAALPWPG